MRFSLFAKQNKVEAINDEDVGERPEDVASKADEHFPDEEEVAEERQKKTRKSRFSSFAFFKKNEVPKYKRERNTPEPHLHPHRMLGVNTLITDSFYQDKEDEADEWRSQMDLFADAYETESVAMSRHSLTPAAEDIKTKKEGNR